MSLSCRVFLIVCLGTLGLSCVSSSVRAQFFPTGVVAENMSPSGSLVRPIAMEFLPDGRLLIAEHHSGRILSWSRGALRTVGTVENLVNGLEHGLLGMALHPQFPRRPFLYLYLTHDIGGGVPDKRVVRYRLKGDLAFGGQGELEMVERYEVLTGIPAPVDLHDGGGLRFGPDGCLYLAVGDATMSCEAQNVNSPFGKILRMDVRGLPRSGPPPPILDLVPAGGNPLGGSTDISQLVFAMGLRNPFRFSIDPLSGTLIIADVGENTWVEINFCTGGENFGWPWFEGPAPFSTCPPGPVPSNLTAPVVAGAHGGSLSFAAAVPFAGIYHNRYGARFNFGPAYEGSLFIADLGIPTDIFRLDFDGQDWNIAPALPGQANPNVWGFSLFPTDCQIGPDGAFWQLTFLDGDVRRTRPEAGGTQLTIKSGQSQKGNAGTLSFVPMEVELTDLNNQALANEIVFFTIERGGGQITASALTDANGRATVSYRFSDTWTGEHPEIIAWHEGGEPQRFSFEWRGLETLLATAAKYLFKFRHSEANSPVVAVIDIARTTPVLTVPAGEIWTSLLAPLPSLIVLGDGFGFVGPQNRGFVTDAAGQRLIEFKVPPTLTGQVIIQAYAIDFAASTAEEVTVSNPVTLTLIRR